MKVKVGSMAALPPVSANLTLCSLPVVGFADDAAVLAAALKLADAHLTPEIENKAQQTLEEFFPAQSQTNPCP